MMSVCKECHHRPSERCSQAENGYSAECYCQCHDVADASPDLLEVCESIAHAVNMQIEEGNDEWQNVELTPEIVKAVFAAIRKAKGGAT